MDPITGGAIGTLAAALAVGAKWLMTQFENQGNLFKEALETQRADHLTQLRLITDTFKQANERLAETLEAHAELDAKKFDEIARHLKKED